MFRTNLGKLAGLAVVALALAALPLNAQTKGPKGVRSNSAKLHRFANAVDTFTIYTNLVGPNHHKYNNASGYFVDAPQYFNQVLGHRFTTGDPATFANAVIPMGLYLSPGGGCCGPHPKVYLAADTGGSGPGALLDGPLSQTNGISKFSDGSNFVEFDCVSCPSLAAGTNYWIVGVEDEPLFEDTWDFSRALTDLSSGGNFAFNQIGSATGPWLIVGDGVIRGAFTVNGN